MNNIKGKIVNCPTIRKVLFTACAFGRDILAIIQGIKTCKIETISFIENIAKWAVIITLDYLSIGNFKIMALIFITAKQRTIVVMRPKRTNKIKLDSPNKQLLFLIFISSESKEIKYVRIIVEIAM